MSEMRQIETNYNVYYQQVVRNDATSGASAQRSAAKTSVDCQTAHGW